MNRQTIAPDYRTAAGLCPQGEAPEIATRNACKVCSPLGAAMVFKGIRGCLPFLHGSQGCATYIRRYLISHFREPVDIASSSFTEDDAIFGGAKNFTAGLLNVQQQYQPELIGVATTCLSETIGENMLGMIQAYKKEQQPGDAPLIHVSTPAYNGTHSDGFATAVQEVIRALVPASAETRANRVNILPAMMSCADLRHLREMAAAFDLEATLLPDYSDTLEGTGWDQYHRMSPGGTSVEEISQMGEAAGTLELGHLRAEKRTSASGDLQERSGVPRHALGWPMGIRLTDEFVTSLATCANKVMPDSLRRARGRVVDAYVDGHKYLSGRTAAVYGEPDLVVALAAFLSEVGIRPILCATGAKVRDWQKLVTSQVEGNTEDIQALQGVDHARVSQCCRDHKPDLLVGSSKGYPLARELEIPLLRLGFPIHDRFGAQRQLTVGYEGTLSLFDQLVNIFLDEKQETSLTGNSYQ
ncbi:MAG: nitrogenase [Opitutales bacterium]|nr:nitrogenase [Opitutales bacterium]